MSFIKTFTDRPVTATMMYAISALIGVFAFFRMPVDLLPGGDSGVLSVFVGIRGGLPPEDIESLVTKPVEDEMATLANLESMSSVSRKERAVVTLVFKPGTDSSRAALEVQERLAKIKGKLPKEIEKPIVSRYDESQSPIMILAMSSKHYTPEEMRDVADNQLKPLLKRCEGVANIEIGGGRERKILIEFDQSRLEAYAIPIRQIISQIGSENLNILMGKMEKANESYFVRTVGAFKTLDDLGDLPVAVTKEGSRIRLRDIADIKDFYLEAESYSRMNREPVVSAYVQKEALSNTIDTAKKIKRTVEEFKKTMDPRISLSIVSDQSIDIEKGLKSVRSALYEGAFLSGVILILFLKDILSSLIIFVSIPLTVVMTLAVMNAVGLSLNVMTISGLALASGMIVDDSIVVLENITHHRTKLLHFLNSRKHALPGAAAADSEAPGGSAAPEHIPIFATEEMMLALSASTLTKVIVFLPIVFLNPQVKMLYTGLAVTVSSSLLISLLVSVTVIPSLSANIPLKWYKESSFFSTYLWLYLGKKWSQGWPKINRWLSAAYKQAQKQLKKLRRKKTVPGDDDLIYASDSRFSLFHTGGGFRWYRHQVAVLMRGRYMMAGFLLVAMVISGFLYKKLDKEFVGTTEDNEFTIFVELPSGVKLEVSDKVVTTVERMLNETPEIKKTMKTSISRIEGWSSKIYVTLVPGTERKSTAQEVIDRLRPLVSQIGQEYSAFVYFSEPSSSKEFIIDLFGYDYNRLRDLAVKVAQQMEKVPGLVDVKLRYKPGRPEVRVEVDREKASVFQFTIQDIAENLHAQIRGLRATYFLTPTAQVETVARLKEMYRKTLDEVQVLSLINPRGTIVPVHQFANFEFGLTPSEIWRKDRERMIQVSANRQNAALSKVAEGALAALRQIDMPTGYYYEIGGDFPKMIETEKESQFAFLIMVLLVYAVLAALFESYIQPVLILVAVPLTLIGAVPLLYFTKTPVTLGTLIGFIMLGGISVSNSIILVDVFNGINKERKTFYALLKAGEERVRPILMTTLTTTLGLAPLAFEKGGSASLWKPLAIAVIGGLTVSTILVLFVLPGFYMILEDLRNLNIEKIKHMRFGFMKKKEEVEWTA